MENSTLTKSSQSQCRQPRVTLGDLINEWLPKLAVNAGAALDAKTQTVYRSIWLEGLGDLSPEVLLAAFRKTLRECPFWPIKVADIRKHITHAEMNASALAAEDAWQRVLDIRRLHWNPDIPGDRSCRLALLPERIQQAARAAGIFRDFESVQDLHVWAKKRFLESYAAYEECEQNQFLLPAELKALLADVAETKSLPASESYKAMRERGLAYAAKIKSSPSELRQPDSPRFRVCAQPTRSIEEQKRILREKGFAI